jgi:hypothetical protein
MLDVAWLQNHSSGELGSGCFWTATDLAVLLQDWKNWTPAPCSREGQEGSGTARCFASLDMVCSRLPCGAFCLAFPPALLVPDYAGYRTREDPPDLLAACGEHWKDCDLACLGSVRLSVLPRTLQVFATYGTLGRRFFAKSVS